MSSYSLRRHAVESLALATLLASAAGAHAAVTITDAKIESARLIVTGTASSGAQVRLDGQEGTAFNARAGADGAYSFSLVYHPGDCMVTAEILVPPYMTTGESAEGLVANCGPAGVTARGAWAEAAAYVRNDLVTHEGSTWRARRNNFGHEPQAGADWEIFAAAGEVAAADGAAGEAGAAAARTPPTGPAGGDLTGAYPDPQIAVGVVTGANLAANSVNQVKLTNDAVGSPEIVNDSVASVDILNGAVQSADIQNETILSTDIATGAVSSAEILDEAITGTDILDASISDADLGFGAVGSGEIQTDAVHGSEIAANAVDGDEILDNSVTAFDIATGAVGVTEIVAGAVTNSELADNSVTTGKIANATIRALDFLGGRSNGAITLNAGFVANGLCRDVGVSVPGANLGDAIVFSLISDVPDGILITGKRISSADVIVANICNLTGGVFPQLNNIQVSVFTIAL